MPGFIPPATARPPHAMTPAERRSSVSLALIFALRMLGLFLVLPVFTLEASRYQGGDNPALIGLAMGIYGLTQALLQLPLGMASDRWGRKHVIVAGMLVFAAGSVLAACADSLMMLTIGRAIQGAGAVSAAVTALLADLTRPAVRTKAMALVGISIAATFALALVIAPPLTALVGLRGLFILTAMLALGSIAVVCLLVPPEPALHSPAATAPCGLKRRDIWRHASLLRLNLSVFVLHAVQMAMWVAVPAMLVHAGLARAQHWQVYLPVIALSALFLGLVFALERRGRTAGLLRLCVSLLALVQLLLLVSSAADRHHLAWLALALLVFFCAFNALEATLPSLVSRLAPAPLRGTALGAYNTMQSLGLFAGGAAGGALLHRYGNSGLFMACALAALLWLALIWPLSIPAPEAAQTSPTG